MQYDGVFTPEGGSEPAYNLSTFLGTEYKNDRDVTFITAVDGPGKQDVWMSGYMDGTCDLDLPIPRVTAGGSRAFTREGDSCGGKVSYLGGHNYTGKAGQRLFMNALFEADCTIAAGQPRFTLSLNGDLVVVAQSLPVEGDYVVGYNNDGAGAALDSVLRALNAASGINVVTAAGGSVSSEGGSWQVGAISGTILQPGDPPVSGTKQATLQFTEFGDHTLTIDIGYRVGVSTLATAADYTIRVLLDSDADSVPDETDPSPNDPTRCGDSDMDGCDDCVSGMFDPANDSCGAGGGASGGDNPSDSAGCGCRISPASESPAFLLALALLGLRRRARRSRR
jgi:MYXO-CTERM domain-containing protein